MTDKKSVVSKMNDFEIQSWLNFHQVDYWFHDGKDNLPCESCDKEFKKGDLIIQSDGGDNYCEECSTE